MMRRITKGPWRIIFVGAIIAFLSLLLEQLKEPLKGTHSGIFHSLPHWIIWVGIGLIIVISAVLTYLYDKLKSSPDTSVATALQNRKCMLDQVEDKWIEGILENKLYYDKKLLTLGLCRSVGDPWDLVLQNPLEPAVPLPIGTKISEVFDHADGKLLILGEPGAGKTTLLLELVRDLIKRARDHDEAPIPVVLTLSSWATKSLPLEQWVIEELKTKHKVPTEIGQVWVEANQLLLLLDGLDEVPSRAQSACIEAVNKYAAQAHRSIVVCSRTKEYLDQSGRLSLQPAVSIQPVSSGQIDDYLLELGEYVSGLKSALHQSETLHTLATTPLILRVLILTYHGNKSAQDVLTLVNTVPTGRQHQLLHDYVERMLQKDGPCLHTTPERTKHWLGWLAHQLTEHPQTELYLEQLQPDWLPKRQRAFYRWGVRLLVGLLVGLVAGLVGELSFGLFVGVLVALVAGPAKIEPVEAIAWSWKKARTGLLIGLPVGLLIGLLIGLPFGLLAGLLAGLYIGLLVGLSTGLVGGFSRRQLTERRTPSPNEGIRRSAKNGLLIGLPVGLLIGLSFGLSFGLLIGLPVGLAAAVQHYILRFWLSCTRTFPWRAVCFLNDTVDQFLLRKVGGGYGFRHLLLQEYFAPPEPTSSPQQ